MTFELLLLSGRLPAGSGQYADSARKVIEKNGFTHARYDSVLAYYENHPMEWETFFKKLQTRLRTTSRAASHRPPEAFRIPGRPD